MLANSLSCVVRALIWVVTYSNWSINQDVWLDPHKTTRRSIGTLEVQHMDYLDSLQIILVYEGL